MADAEWLKNEVWDFQISAERKFRFQCKHEGTKKEKSNGAGWWDNTPRSKCFKCGKECWGEQTEGTVVFNG